MIDFVNAYSEPYFEFVGVDCSAKLVKELHTSSLLLLRLLQAQNELYPHIYSRFLGI